MKYCVHLIFYLKLNKSFRDSNSKLTQHGSWEEFAFLYFLYFFYFFYKKYFFAEQAELWPKILRELLFLLFLLFLLEVENREIFLAPLNFKFFLQKNPRCHVLSISKPNFPKITKSPNPDFGNTTVELRKAGVLLKWLY